MKHHAQIILIVLFWLSATAPLWADPIQMCPSPNLAPSQKESPMLLDAPKTINEAVPPIDRAAPVKFETASFGLG